MRSSMNSTIISLPFDCLFAPIWLSNFTFFASPSKYMIYEQGGSVVLIYIHLLGCYRDA